MKLIDQDFQIEFDEIQNILKFSGVLRSNNIEEFEKIKGFMLDVYDLEKIELILDFTQLEFMNSAGISTLCRFVMDAKEKSLKKMLKIIGNITILWQVKSFENLIKIWDKIALELR
jgi:hypothetical protein